MRAMEDRARSSGCLPTALRTHEYAFASAPTTPRAAFRAAEPIRPPHLLQITPARGVIGKPGPELLIRPGIVHAAQGSLGRLHGPQATALKQISRKKFVKTAIHSGGCRHAERRVRRGGGRW